jgi:hypothetical protein
MAVEDQTVYLGVKTQSPIQTPLKLDSQNLVLEFVDVVPMRPLLP